MGDIGCGVSALFDGDSLTEGIGSTGGNTYPAQTVAALGTHWGAINLGASSLTIVQMQARAATTVDPYYSVASRRTLLIGWGGTKDLYFGASAATTYNNIKTYAAARKAAGWRVVILSILPRSAGTPPPTFEADRQTVNAALLADFPTATAHTNITSGGAYADYLINIGADTTIGEPGDQTNPTYYADLVHLTNAGYAIVADYVKKAIQLFP